MNDESLTVHTDGGSRGNPGPAACAFVIEIGNKEIAKGSNYLGKATNNFAEYSGVLLAINHLVFKQLQSFANGPIVFYADSELMVKQLGGLYKIKNESLRKLAMEIWKLINKNHLQIKFVHILRDKNNRADFLVNQELDNN